ncbi:uncharacterized protein EI97DRAFT_432245 [Westerdykella ornata]|uniref:SGNH hydrolase n=1 Tax=Westerdykella ornata TaxID=318751 RepID=A0A6A6JLI7_WESOR|nr:uncharacterized protein EI97DRAFT_432245 [Westerdykella ornata]KAF2277367.1 hypothetical protein EI97DRAFT_432245 [Westerdykella ornata]
MPSKINSSAFFSEWKGHPISDLAKFRDTTRAVRPGKPIVYLAGDSSLDNKAWVTASEPISPAQIYKETLRTSSYSGIKPDIAYWLNHFLGDRATCINAAIEESLLRERDDRLLEHDLFIRDSITANDILIVSVGANDIALRPTTSTMLHMADLAWTTRRSSIQDGSASSLVYFRKMFKDKTENYISRMLEKQKPRAVIVCMIYYPLEADAGQTGWADMQLKALGYNMRPGQLQAAIKQIYESATKNIRIEGTQVLTYPLFEVLDPRDAKDFTARVEPSTEGGRKMAQRFSEMVTSILGDV